jgi:hypothetical protein
MLRYAITFAFICAALGAQAQVTYTGYRAMNETTAGAIASGYLEYDLTEMPDPIGPAHELTHFHNGVINLTTPRTEGTWTTYYQGRTFFNVGQIPVALENSSMSWYFKLVNGGGDSSTVSYVYGWLYLYEYEDDNLNGIWDAGSEALYGPAFGVSTLLAQLEGNGANLYANSAVNDGTFMLSAGRSYMLSSHLALQTSHGNLDSFFVTQVTTLEFTEPTFDGFYYDIEYRVVPEPATLAFLGAGALALFGRRRKRS